MDQFLKWQQGNEIWALAVIQETPAAVSEVLPEPISAVLTEFSDVFAEPHGLPLPRTYDHAIALQPGAAPFNSHPYHYSPLHKTEIERQVM